MAPQVTRLGLIRAALEDLKAQYREQEDFEHFHMCNELLWQTEEAARMERVWANVMRRAGLA